MMALGKLLIALSAAALLASLRPIGAMTAASPLRSERRAWYFLQGLIYLFILGLGYEFFRRWVAYDPMMVGLFSVGLCFAAVVAVLSRKAAALERDSITDPLTGLFNRRYLERRLADEVNRCRRYARPLSVLLLDIDHFKRINDTFGHAEGDRILKGVGDLLRRTVRKSDVVVRYGGEEILLIIPETDAARAEVLGQRIRQTIEASPSLAPRSSGAQPSSPTTVSIGVSELEAPDGGTVAILERADRAMYQSKAQGRNRVSVAPRAGTDATERAFLNAAPQSADDRSGADRRMPR